MAIPASLDSWIGLFAETTEGAGLLVKPGIDGILSLVSSEQEFQKITRASLEAAFAKEGWTVDSDFTKENFVELWNALEFISKDLTFTPKAKDEPTLHPDILDALGAVEIFFIPRVSVEEATCDTAKFQKEAVITLLNEKDQKLIEDVIEIMWAEMLEELAPEMREVIPDKATSEFYKPRFYPTGMKHFGIIPVITPGIARVAVNASTCSTEASEKHALCNNMTLAENQEVEETVVTQWKEHLRRLPADIRECLNVEEIPITYWAKHYYPIAAFLAPSWRLSGENIMSPHVKESAQEKNFAGNGKSAGDKSGMAEEVYGVDAFLSGNVFSNNSLGKFAEVKWCSSANLLEENSPVSYVMYEGWCMHGGKTLQSHSVPDRMSASPKKRNVDGVAKTKAAADVICFDRTGPVMIAVWNECVPALVEGLLKKKNGLCLVSFDILRVGDLKSTDWNGTMLSTMKQLNTIEQAGVRKGTKIGFPEKVSSPYLKDHIRFRAPDEPACYSDFQSFHDRFQAPFRLTACGVIAHADETTTISQAGNLQRAFHLIDDNGLWFKCVAMHENANHKCIQEDMRVVVYFGTGRGPIGSAEGAIYIMKDAMIIPIGRNATSISKRIQLEIQASPS